MFRICICFILFSFVGCSKNDPSISKNLIVVPILPYEFLVKKIVEDTIEVRSLIPAGANAHSYEPTPKKVKELREASVWLQLGEPLEKAVEPSVQQKNTSLIIYRLTDHLSLLEDCCVHHQKETKDLHIWLSPLLMKEQAVFITDILVNRFPEHSDLYRNNLKTVLLELDDLHFFIENTLDPLKKRFLFVTHPAFGYFCREYECTQIPIEFEGKDPLPKQLNNVLALARESDVQAIISLPQFSQKSAKVVSNTLHLPIYKFDPYMENYMENMKYLANLVVLSNE